MKPKIGKSINQSMTIHTLLVNWHRLASANRWPIDNHIKVVATHHMSSISVKKILVSDTFQPRLYVYALAVRTKFWDLKFFTRLFVRSRVVSKINKKHSLKQCFEETQVNNAPFRLVVPFAVLYTVNIGLIWIFRNFIFPLFPIFPTGPVHTPCKMKSLLSDLSM